MENSAIGKAALPEEGLDVLLKEYDMLRGEIAQRLKIAFSHIAYAGGIGAFALPAANSVPNWVPIPISIGFAIIAGFGLLWIAILNMRWVEHCGKHVMSIEERVNSHFGCRVLSWEHYATKVQKASWILIPEKPKLQDK